ncbi:hypothetical protein BGZ80_002394 [Entomortierella chlamydospora]|uniref:Uncharacterized protein n=1 Tax=Entomortierella chlamydospora TaxID=101097 RepID=A0A9P6N182_9FUNG|nr:hypothetical protein BGZ80_002394 [Entomortierella chlamydospora]
MYYGKKVGKQVLNKDSVTEILLAHYNSNLAPLPDEELAIAQLTNAYTDFIPGVLSYSIADEILGLPKTEDWM